MHLDRCVCTLISMDIICDFSAALKEAIPGNFSHGWKEDQPTRLSIDPKQSKDADNELMSVLNSIVRIYVLSGISWRAPAVSSALPVSAEPVPTGTAIPSRIKVGYLFVHAQSAQDDTVKSMILGSPVGCWSDLLECAVN